MSDGLLTTREVAAMLARSPETVLRWHRSGKLPGGRRLATNCLRWRADVVEEWLEPTDVDRLAGELRSPYDVAVMVGAWTYLRPSELLALERGDIDGDALHVRRTLDGEGGTKASGKTDAR